MEKKTPSKVGCFRKVEEIFISGLAAKTAQKVNPVPPEVSYAGLGI